VIHAGDLKSDNCMTAVDNHGYKGKPSDAQPRLDVDKGLNAVNDNAVIGVSLGLGEKHVGPSQPHLNKYPSTKIGKQNRSFTDEWFTKFPWIEYSIHKMQRFASHADIFTPRLHMLTICSQKGDSKAGNMRLEKTGK